MALIIPNKTDDDLYSLQDFQNDLSDINGRLDNISAIKDTLSGTLQGKITLKPNTVYTLTGDITVNANTVIDGRLATIKGDIYKFICGSNVEIMNCDFQVLTPRATGTTLLNQQAVTVLFKDAVNCKIHDCTGDGLVLAFDNVDGFVCENNSFKGGHSYDAAYRRSSCQAINGSKNGVFRKNKISYSTGDGLHLDDVENITWEDNEAISDGFTGFFVAYSKNIKLYRNVARDHATYDGFDLNTASYSASDTIHKGLYSTKRNIEAIGNRAYNNAGAGMYCTGSQFILKANFIYNNGTNGIRINPTTGDTSYTNDNIVEGNTVYDNNTGNYANGSGFSHEITIVNCENSIVTNNIVYHSSGNIDKCIYLSGRNNKITNNNCYLTGTATSPISDLLQVITDTGYQNMLYGNTGVSNRNKKNLLTLVNSFTNVGAPNPSLCYILNPDGRPTVLGVLGATGTPGTVATTFDTIARPSEKRFIKGIGKNTDGTFILAEAELNTDGTFVPNKMGTVYTSFDDSYTL